MGRPRKHRLDLPQRVYFEDGRYRYKPKGAKTVELGTDLAEALTRGDVPLAVEGLSRWRK